MITDAWVIRKYWSGDTSARVVFFTHENGLVNCYYKGGRTPKKQALLQAFTPLWLSTDVRGDAHFVRHLEMLSTPLALRGTNLFAGLYVNELLYLALRSLDPNTILHTAYKHVLHALVIANDRFSVERALRRFEWVLLSSSGYPMSLTHDARTEKPIMHHHHYQFIAGEGFVLADTGILGAHILALAEDKLEDVDVLGAAKRIMRCAIDHLLDGKTIRARELYR